MAILSRDNALGIYHVERWLQAGVHFVSCNEAMHILCILLYIFFFAFELGGFFNACSSNSFDCGDQHVVLLWQFKDDLVDSPCEAFNCKAHTNECLRDIELLSYSGGGNSGFWGG
jgi:hypothetical protein